MVYIVCRNSINRALSAKCRLYKADNRGNPLYIKPPNKKDTFKDAFLFGGDSRGRTGDLLNAIQALYHLSYIPKHY